MALRVDLITYHRNGSFGDSYHRLQFTDDELPGVTLQAIAFATGGCVAVIDHDGKAYRCEDFEADLRAFIDSPEGQSRCWPGQCAANEA